MSTGWFTRCMIKVYILCNAVIIIVKILKQEIIIDGDEFDNLAGLHIKVDKKLTKDLSWQTGHNPNASNDILWGGLEFSNMKNQ